MKTQVYITAIMIFAFIFSGIGQIKIINNGNVGIGISYPLNSLHVWGFDQKFNYNGREILFRPSNSNSEMGSNYGSITFWHPAAGYNNIIRNSCSQGSDQRIKHDISPMENMLSVIKQLTPKSFKYIDSIVPGNQWHYGFIAQDVMPIIPELVDSIGKWGYLTLNYEGMIPFLVGAVKEQASVIDSLKHVLGDTSHSNGARMVTTQVNTSAKVDSLNQQIKALQKQVQDIQNNCCRANNNATSESQQTANGINTVFANTVSNGEGVLLQNVPNPFNNTTTIQFNIPERYDGRFYIKIYTLVGEERLSFSVNKTDKSISVSAGNLPPGIYLYSLIANNDVLGIKQMVISK